MKRKVVWYKQEVDRHGAIQPRIRRDISYSQSNDLRIRRPFGIALRVYRKVGGGKVVCTKLTSPPHHCVCIVGTIDPAWLDHDRLVVRRSRFVVGPDCHLVCYPDQIAHRLARSLGLDVGFVAVSAPD